MENRAVNKSGCARLSVRSLMSATPVSKARAKRQGSPLLDKLHIPGVIGN